MSQSQILKLKKKSKKKKQYGGYAKQIYDQNIFNIDEDINLSHYKLMKGGTINSDQISNTKEVVNKSIRKDLESISKVQEENYELIIPTLEEKHQDINYLEKSQKLQDTAHKRINELEKLSSKSDNLIDNKYFEVDNYEINELTTESSKYQKFVLNYMNKPITFTENFLNQSKSAIIYAQILVIFLRSIICANLVYSQNSKQIIITIWEIVAESPHLWVYINEYGIKSLGWLGKQIIKFPIFRMLFELITRLVYQPSEKSAEEIIDYLTDSISSYLNMFLSKAATAYNVYRYLTAKDGPSTNLHNALSKLGSTGLSGIFGQSWDVLWASGSSMRNFFNLTLQPENIVSLYAKKIKGDPDASIIVKSISSNASWVIGWICKIVCMNTFNTFVQNAETECSLCNILLNLPFVASSLYSISIDLLEGVWLLQEYYGNKKNIKQSTLISALCVRRLPFESTDSLVERKSNRNLNLITQAALRGWIKEDNNGEIIALSSSEIKNNEIPNKNQAKILREKFIKRNSDKNFSDLIKKNIGINENNSHEQNLEKLNNFINGDVEKSNLQIVSRNIKNINNQLDNQINKFDQKFLNNNLDNSKKILDNNFKYFKDQSQNLYHKFENNNQISTIKTKILSDAHNFDNQVKDFQRKDNFNNHQKKLLLNLEMRLNDKLPNEDDILKTYRNDQLDKVINSVTIEEKMLDENNNQDIESKLNNIKKYIKDTKNQKKNLFGIPYIIENQKKQYLDNKLLNKIQDKYYHGLEKEKEFLNTLKIQYFWNQNKEQNNIKKEITDALFDKMNKPKTTYEDHSALEALNKYRMFLRISDDHKKNILKSKKKKNEDYDNFDDENFDNFELEDMNLEDFNMLQNKEYEFIKTGGKKKRICKSKKKYLV